MKKCVKETLNAFGKDADVMVVVVKDGTVSIISDNNKGMSVAYYEIEKAINGIVNGLNEMGH